MYSEKTQKHLHKNFNKKKKQDNRKYPKNQLTLKKIVISKISNTCQKSSKIRIFRNRQKNKQRNQKPTQFATGWIPSSEKPGDYKGPLLLIKPRTDSGGISLFFSTDKVSTHPIIKDREGRKGNWKKYTRRDEYLPRGDRIRFLFLYFGFMCYVIFIIMKCIFFRSSNWRRGILLYYENVR